MKKLLLIFTILPFLSEAQNFYFSARAGLAGYQGDLKKTTAVLSQMKLMGSIGAQYDLTEHISTRSYISYGSLKADDKKGTATMKERNLNFQTRLLDWEIGAQYNFFNMNYRWWTPYVSVGAGIFHYNPYTKNADDEKVFLRPLSTEGQGFVAGVKPYKLTQFSIPLAFGVNYSTGEDTRIGIEFGYRKIFTDYLDDVSTVYVGETDLRAARGEQAVELAWRGDEITGNSYPNAGALRGGPDYKDGYYYVAVTFIIRYWFDKYKQVAGLPGGSKQKKVGCPASRVQGY
jgi:hypothetical protein